MKKMIVLLLTGTLGNIMVGSEESSDILHHQRPIEITATYKLSDFHADLYVHITDAHFSLEEMKHHLPNHDILVSEDVCHNKQEFAGKAGQQLPFIGVRCDGAYTFHAHALGVGSIEDTSEDEQIEYIRKAITSMFKTIDTSMCQKVVVRITQALLDRFGYDKVVREITATSLIASYRFTTYITHKPSQPPLLLILDIPPSDDLATSRAIFEGYAIGKTVNEARTWSNLPPSVKTPRWMAAQALRIAQLHPETLTCTVLSEEEIAARGMGGIVAVSRGSIEPCTLVIMEYRSSNPEAPTIALVGKGVTFDSGGINLKGSGHISDMKYDMAGGAVVIATMHLLALLQPDRFNVIGIVPFTENMPDGAAIKPSDIVTFYNGTTAEIINTDAEGRLILADALSYAIKEYRPDAIIDIATLTGACMRALGDVFGGIMGNDAHLIKALIRASRHSGDRLWQLPFDHEYQTLIKSPVADLANLASSDHAGATTAACFLSHFVGKIPWAHLDVAGTSWDRHGATGFGLRLFAEFLLTTKYQPHYHDHRTVTNELGD